MIKETSAGVVLFRKEDSKIMFLLLHYPSGHWDFVKGKIEGDESNQQTATRETQEETGIADIEFIENFEEWIGYHFQYNGEVIDKKVVFFLAETKTKNIKISDEHVDYAWADYNTAIKKATFDNAKIVLKKAKNLLDQTL